MLSFHLETSGELCQIGKGVGVTALNETVKTCWLPDAAQTSRMAEFMRLAQAATGLPLDDYSRLHRWSVESPDEFWGLLADFVGLQFSTPATSVLDSDGSMQSARWFSGARLNVAERLLEGPDTDVVIVAVAESGVRSAITRGELKRMTLALANELRARGIVAGDRVAAVLPNGYEAVVAFLATASLGGVFSSCSPDFGVQGLTDRFGQIAPRVLIGCSGYEYAGKSVDCTTEITALLAQLDSVELAIVVLSSGAKQAGLPRGDALLFDELVSNKTPPERFDPLPFDHPLVILYSSGTTGKPKCIVHGCGGTLLQHLKEHVLHTDVGPDDTLFYFTTCGWMMWNWLVSGLATGGTIVLYDGSPGYPRPGRLFELAQAERITVLGTSPTYLLSSEKAGIAPGREFELSQLRTVLSTGSPLPPQSFDWIEQQFNGRVQLSSISGGTDIISCFALGNPLLPVHRGELQSAGLGMAVAVLNEHGEPVEGEPGELVCTQAFPSMPLGFWNDPGQEKYTAAYFERFPGKWAHGDVAELTPRDGFIIHGRADAVLNPSGVRIGTAEIYNPVLKLSEVDDCVAVAQDWQDDVRIVLFVVLADALQLTPDLQETIRDAVRRDASPRHSPKKIIQVPEIPRTRSGKIVELAVRAVVNGEPVRNREAIANPEALAAFQDLDELRT